MPMYHEKSTIAKSCYLGLIACSMCNTLDKSGENQYIMVLFRYIKEMIPEFFRTNMACEKLDL